MEGVPSRCRPVVIDTEVDAMEYGGITLDSLTEGLRRDAEGLGSDLDYLDASLVRLDVEPSSVPAREYQRGYRDALEDLAKDLEAAI